MPASRDRRDQLLDSMRTGQCPAEWWAAAARTHIYRHGTRYTVDDILGLVRQLRAQLAPFVAPDTESDADDQQASTSATSDTHSRAVAATANR